MDSKKFSQLVEDKKKRVLERKQAPLKWEQKLEAAAKAKADAEAKERKQKAAKHKRRSESRCDTESDSNSSDGRKARKRSHRKHRRYNHSASSDDEKSKEKKSKKKPKRSSHSSDGDSSDFGRSSVEQRKKKRHHKKYRNHKSRHDTNESDYSSDDDDGATRKRGHAKHTSGIQNPLLMNLQVMRTMVLLGGGDAQSTKNGSASQILMTHIPRKMITEETAESIISMVDSQIVWSPNQILMTALRKQVDEKTINMIIIAISITSIGTMI